MKTIHGRKAKVPRICLIDKALAKILKFEAKHKIEDKYEEDFYRVVDQPSTQSIVFDVRSDK